MPFRLPLFIAVLVCAAMAAASPAAAFSRSIACSTRPGELLVRNPGPGAFQRGWIVNWSNKAFVIGTDVPAGRTWVKYVTVIHHAGPASCRLSNGGLL